MEYQVTATRRRPQNLEQLSGQTFVQQTLQNAIESGRIAHSFLFSGPRGVGKTSVARILARALNCEKGPTITPCGVCVNCHDMLNGKSLDIIEIDGASHTGVDDIREIKDEVLYAPSSSRYKVFIIDEVHMLSNSAFNALLKTIEEPPEYIVFIFATTEIHKVPLTVRSRCQHYNFHLIGLEQIQHNLNAACKELNLTAQPEALTWIAREAKGSMRDAYTLFDQVASFTHDKILSLDLIQKKMGLVAIDQLGHLCEALSLNDMQRAMEVYQKIIQSGTSLEQFLVDLCEYLRAVLLLHSKLNPQQLQILLPYPPDHYSKMVIATWNREQLLHIIERCFNLYRNLRYSINEQFEVELFLFELGQLRYYSSSAHQLQQLEKLTDQLQKGIMPLPSDNSAKTASNSGSTPATITTNTQAPQVAKPQIKSPVQQQVQQQVQQTETAPITPQEQTHHTPTAKDIKTESSQVILSETSSKPDILLQAKQILMIQQPQLAAFLEAAKWEWDSTVACLTLRLQNEEARRPLSQANSLLLHQLQRELPSYKITSLKILPVPNSEKPVSNNDQAAVSNHEIKPELPPNLNQPIIEQPLTAQRPNNPEPLTPQDASPAIELPAEIQILQKVLAAEVKEVRHYYKNSDYKDVELPKTT